MPRAPRLLKWAALVWLFCAAGPAQASSEVGHADPVAHVVFALALILLTAKLAGHLAVRVRQPSVLGELLVGVLFGNLDRFGFNGLEFLASDPTLDMLARLGVILLLFEVGLESTVAQMVKVGASSFAVASIGVIVPTLLGIAVGRWLLPNHSGYVHAFLGATLSATSVGITARVLQDLGRSRTSEARVVLGAAVIDDVLGLVVLAVVAGAIQAADVGASLSWLSISWIIGKATIFLVGALLLGIYLSPRLFHLASHLQVRGVLLAVGLALCFFLAWLASVIGLAPIVGAFAAGLVLEQVHFRDFVDRGEHTLEELVKPVSGTLAPVFFVLMGARTDLAAFTRPGVLGLAAALTLAAILGKQACGLGVIGKGIDRVAVGAGMIPRGEVGLIFANIGLTLKIGNEPIVTPEVFSAVVAMVIVTTLATPFALKWAFKRIPDARATDAEAGGADAAKL